MLLQYEKEQLNKNKKYENDCKKWKHLNSKETPENQKILSLLNSLEINENANNEEIQKKDFTFIFGEEIDQNKLLSFLEKIIPSINESYPDNVKLALKNFFNNKTIIENIKIMSNNNGIISTLKKDIFINLLLEKNKKNLSNVNSLILCNMISLVPLQEISIKDGENIIIFDKNFLINAVNTEVISNIYCEVCAQYINAFDDKIDVKEQLKEHINGMNIFFGELPENVCALTLYTGDVIVNGKYLNLIYSEEKNNNIIKKQGVCVVFLSILHEFNHIITRKIKLLTKDITSVNTFIESEDLASVDESNFENITLKEFKQVFNSNENKISKEFKAIIADYNANINSNVKTNSTPNEEKKTNKFNESGDFFDFKLFHTKYYSDITESESNFFLNLENFTLTNKEYYERLKAVYKERETNNNQIGYRFKYNSAQSYTVNFGRCLFSFRNK
jgi:hypothetical protein